MRGFSIIDGRRPSRGFIFALMALVALSVGCDTQATEEPPDGFVAVEIPTEDPGTVQLPGSWAHVSHAGINAELGIAASPRASLVDEVVHGNGANSMSGNEDLRADDVFVEVWGSYQPVAGGFDLPQLPRRLGLDAFEVDRQLLGAVLYTFAAEGRGGGRYDIHYWIGPDAAPDVEEQLYGIIRSLRFRED